MKKTTLVLITIAIIFGQTFVSRSETEPEKLFDNFTTSSPNFKSKPTKDAKFTITQPFKIVGIATVHWNEGKGTTEYGKVSLKNTDGTVYGPWQTKGYDEKTSSEKIFWITEPNEVIKAGTYTIIDSQPSTWSWSDESKGVGLAIVAGFKAEGTSNQSKVSEKTIVFQIGNPKMTVNGVSVEIDPGKGTSPAVVGGRTMLPIRSLIETLGGTVGWEASTQTVKLKLANVEMKLVIGKTEAFVSSVAKQLDQPPIIIKGRTLLPLRFVSENVGCSVDWENSTKKITIRFLGSLISAYDGGEVSSQDGAILSFGKNSASGNISASIQKVQDAKNNMSAQYKVEILSGSSGSFSIGIPLPMKFDRNKDQALALRYNEETGKWDRFNAMASYDDKTGVYTFFDSIDDLPKPETQVYLLSYRRGLPGNRKTYAVEITHNWTDSAVTVQIPDSRFKISYYRSGKGCFFCLGDRVPSDSAWDAVGSGSYPATNVDHYVQDLDKALNDAYTQLLDVGYGTLFQPLTLPFTVWIQDCGAGIQGETPLGGGYFNRLFISCNQIENYQQMKLVASHELIHVFQGQYYNIVSARNDRWFIEAVAMGLSTALRGVSETEAFNYYKGNNSQVGYENYLRTNLYANDANSYYACGLFVEWLFEQYDQGILLLIYRANSSTDYSRIDEVFREDNSSFSSEFFKYCQYLQTHPQGGHGLNSPIKASIRRNQNSKERIFTTANLFYNFKTTLQSYTARMAGYSVNEEITSPGLLVVESGGSKNSIRTNSYNTTSNSDSAYEGKNPLEGTDYLIPYSKTLTLSYFGSGQSGKSKVKNFEQMFVNFLPYSDAQANMNYYVLLEPKQTKLEKGLVKWSYSQQANIPLDYINGYNIIVNGVKLSGKTPLRPVKGEMTFKHEGILKSPADVVRIQVVDKFGNIWPNDISVVNEVKVVFQNRKETVREERDASGNTFKVVDVSFDINITDLPPNVKPQISIDLGDESAKIKASSYPVHVSHTYPNCRNPFDAGFTITVEVADSSGKLLAKGVTTVGGCDVKVP